MTISTIDLDKLTFQDLTALIEQANEQLSRKREDARFQLLSEMRTKAAELGISLQDLVGSPAKRQAAERKPRSDAGKPVDAKYRSPEGETWTGRGRMPKWLTEAIHHGKTKEEFTV
jgi:DNA-binding protein H-NS